MYIRVPADTTETALFFKKFVVEPVHYHRVFGARFGQCVLSLKISSPSVRLEPHEWWCLKFNVCEDHTKMSVQCHFVYCRTYTMDTLQERYVHFWAHVQATRQITRVRK